MRTEDAWLHRYSILVAFCVLLVLINGAIVTSLERPISPVSPAPTTPAAVSFESWHRLGVLFVAVLIAGLAAWLAKGSKDPQLRQVGWIVLSIFVVEGALGAVFRRGGSRHGIHIGSLKRGPGTSIAAARGNRTWWNRRGSGFPWLHHFRAAALVS